jgi:hypothetical protein
MIRKPMNCYNNNRLKMLLLLQLLCFSVGLSHAQSGIQDFAYQAQLSASDQSLQRVELPVDVLLSLTRNDLGDVVVFDAANRLMPSWVRQKPAQFKSEQLDLEFHRFSTFREMRSKTLSTRQVQNQDNLTSERQTIETIPVQSTRHDYIIELTNRQQQPGLQHIELEWMHEPADQMLSLRVEVGKDLDQWKTLHESKSLTNRDSTKPEWTRIDSIPGAYRYIRLTSLKPVESFELLRVSGAYEYEQSIDPVWHKLSVLQSDETRDGLYHFDLPEGLRAHQIRLNPVQQESFIKGDLYASQDDFEHKVTIKRDWQQHSFNSSNDIQPSKPVQINSLSYKNWWFYSAQSLHEAPELEVAFPVYEVLFLNNGNGPFKLAWGNYDAEKPANDLLGILGSNARDTQSVLVSLSGIQTSGGASRLHSGQGLPWFKWLLWFLLFVAVGVTGKMAYSLYRDMNSA